VRLLWSQQVLLLLLLFVSNVVLRSNVVQSVVYREIHRQKTCHNHHSTHNISGFFATRLVGSRSNIPEIVSERLKAVAARMGKTTRGGSCRREKCLIGSRTFPTTIEFVDRHLQWSETPSSGGGGCF
jgi:hypothetical protein